MDLTKPISQLVNQCKDIIGSNNNYHDTCDSNDINCDSTTVLIIQLYNSNPIKEKNRHIEFSRTLQKNIVNKRIKRIHVLTEVFMDDLMESFGVNDMIENQKIVQTVIGKRLTFSLAFQFAYQNLNHGDIAIIANADIHFDDTLVRIPKILLQNDNGKDKLIALLRWERNYKTNTWVWQPRTDSQDAWIFQITKQQLFLKKDIISKLDFELGTPACDNRLVNIFESSGIEVINPSLDIKALHLHASSYRKPKEAVSGTLSFLPLTFPRY